VAAAVLVMSANLLQYIKNFKIVHGLFLLNTRFASWQVSTPYYMVVTAKPFRHADYFHSYQFAMIIEELMFQGCIF
jgi:hypothetical protein